MKDLKLNDMENLTEILAEIDNLSTDKKNRIYELLQRSAMVINDIECEFHDTDLKYKLLKPDSQEPTLWTQLQSVSKLFK